MIREDLSWRRLLVVWAPLAATFLLVTGATPVVNASINRLPGRDQESELAAFAVFLACTIVLHSPLFVAREIAIKLSVDRAGSRRALRFCLGAAGVISLVEVLLGATPLGAGLLRVFTDRPEVVSGANRAFLIIAPAPFLIAVRGVYQAHQIRVDDTLFVGLGTLVRLSFTAVIGLVLAPRLGMSGPVLGGICIVAGLAVETAFTVVRARARARPPHTSEHAGIARVLPFGLPLMFANLLGVGASLFYLRVAGMVPEESQKFSLAAFQEVKSVHWLLGAGGFALQSLTTAKVASRADGHAMLRFSLLVGGGLTAVFAVLALTPLRDWILVDLMNERPGGAVVAFATPAMMLAVAMPLMNAVRFCLRGILISRARTRAITAANVTAIVLISTAVAFEALPFRDNGALNAYVLWTIVLAMEITILARIAFGREDGDGGLPAPVRTPQEAVGG